MSFSGGYQSKVLKFVVQQSRQLSDRLQQQARQTKVTTVWGLQVLLYPFYRLLQTTRSQPLRQAMAKGWSQLHRLKGGIVTGELEPVDQPAPDTPIQRVLEAIRCYGLAAAAIQSSAAGIAPELSQLTGQAIVAVEIKPLRRLSLLARSKQGLIRIWQRVGHLSTASTTSGELSAPAQIQGIATLLPNRHLVLVTTQNQVLDILTPQQQHQLQQWLIWEFTEYCRRLRTAYRLAGLAVSLPQWRTDGRSPSLSPSAQKPALPAKKIRKLSPASQLPTIALPVWNSLWQKLKSGVSELGELLALPVSPPALPPIAELSSPELVTELPHRQAGLVAALFQSVKSTEMAPAAAIQINEATEAKPALTAHRSFAVAGAAGVEIEAEAFVIGYEKHFLEQILEGLDRLMVWLEAIAAYLWQKLSAIEPIQRWQKWISRFFS